MTQLEFFKLSEKQVLLLNGSKKEECNEAWRDGFNYACRIIEKAIENDLNDDFFEKMNDLAYARLDTFNWDKDIPKKPQSIVSHTNTQQI